MTEHRVVYLPGAEPPNEICKQAADADLEDVVIIGWHKGEDGLMYYDTSFADRAHVIYLIEALRSHIMSPDDD